MNTEKIQIDLLECIACGKRVYPGEECPECGSDSEVQKVGIERKLDLRRVIGNPIEFNTLIDELEEFATMLHVLQSQGYEISHCSGAAIFVQRRDDGGVGADD